MPTDPPAERGSYDETKIGSLCRDKMRHELGDKGTLTEAETGERIWLLSDVELDALLGDDETKWPKRYPLAVAEAAEGLAVEKAQSPDLYEDESGVRVEWKKRIEIWERLAVRMRSQAEISLSRSVGPTFRVGEMNGPDLSRLR